MKGASAVQPFGLRLPQQLKDWVKEEAEREHRSMNGQLIAELEARRAEKLASASQVPA